MTTHERDIPTKILVAETITRLVTNADLQRAFYKSFGRPIAKVFFMALFTYQVLHYTWMRLESMEEKEEKSAELQGLEGRLRELTNTKTTGKKEA